jgi:hypothetical protein
MTKTQVGLIIFNVVSVMALADSFVPETDWIVNVHFSFVGMSAQELQEIRMGQHCIPAYCARHSPNYRGRLPFGVVGKDPVMASQHLAIMTWPNVTEHIKYDNPQIPACAPSDSFTSARQVTLEQYGAKVGEWHSFLGTPHDFEQMSQSCLVQNMPGKYESFRNEPWYARDPASFRMSPKSESPFTVVSYATLKPNISVESFRDIWLQRVAQAQSLPTLVARQALGLNITNSGKHLLILSEGYQSAMAYQQYMAAAATYNEALSGLVNFETPTLPGNVTKWRGGEYPVPVNYFLNMLPNSHYTPGPTAASLRYMVDHCLDVDLQGWMRKKGITCDKMAPGVEWNRQVLV